VGGRGYISQSKRKEISAASTKKLETRKAPIADPLFRFII